MHLSAGITLIKISHIALVNSTILARQHVHYIINYILKLITNMFFIFPRTHYQQYTKDIAIFIHHQNLFWLESRKLAHCIINYQNLFWLESRQLAHCIINYLLIKIKISHIALVNSPILARQHAHCIINYLLKLITNLFLTFPRTHYQQYKTQLFWLDNMPTA
jgi:hypothetical protein